MVIRHSVKRLRRVATVSLCGTVLLGTAVAGGEGASAQDKPANPRCYGYVYDKFQENCDGWVIQVQNQTDFEFQPKEVVTGAPECKPYRQDPIPARAGKKEDGTYGFVEVARGRDDLWQGPGCVQLGYDSVEACIELGVLGRAPEPYIWYQGRVKLTLADDSSSENFDRKLPVRVTITSY